MKATPGRSSSTKAAARSAGKGGRFWGPFRVSGSLDFQTIYDDNIERYSDVNILRWRQGDFRAGEFDLNTRDDLILSPRLNLNLGTRILGSRESAIRLNYTRWQYARNPRKSNDSWGVRLRQPVSARGFAELGYTFAPMALIRPLGDRAPFDPFSTVAYGYYPFRSARNAFLLAYQHRISGRLTGRVEGGRVIRFYNQRFMENDNWEWNASGSGTVTLASAWKTSLKYTYSNVKSRAMDTLGETAQISDNEDPSYRRDLYQVAFDFGPSGGFGPFTAWDITGQYMEYYYTSTKPYWEDATHVGRKDEVSVVETTLETRPVWGPVTLELGYRHTRRTSSSSSSSTASASLEEDKNYHNARFWLGASYPF